MNKNKAAAPSRSENVILNTASGIVQRIVTILSGFIVQFLLIHLLGIEYVGLSSLFTSVIGVLSLAELGIGSAITYNLYKPIAEKDYEKMSGYVRLYAKTYRLVALTVLGIGLCLTPFIRYIVKDIPNVQENIQILFLLTLLDTVLSYLLVYKSTMLIAAQKNRVVTNVQTAGWLLKCVLLAVVIKLFGSYYLVLVVYALVTVAQNLLISFLADREFPMLRKYKTKLEKAETKSLFANVRAMALYKVSGVVLNSTGNILLSSLYGTAKVGILSNYNLIINNIYTLLTQFYTAISSSVGNLGTEKDESKEYAVFGTLNFITFWLYAFCTTAILTLSQPFIEMVFGSDFLFPVTILVILTADFYIKGMISPLRSFRNAHGLFVQGKYRPLIMAILNLLLALVLVRFIGIAGIFAAMLIARLATEAWYEPMLIYRHVFHKNVGSYFKTYGGYLAVTILLCGCTWLATCFVQLPSSILTFCLRVIITALLPNLLILLIYGRTNECRQLLALIKIIVKKVLHR